MANTEVSSTRFGSYEVLERLGGGGMAEVFRARHVDLNVDRALKLIRPEFTNSERFRQMFRDEAQAVARLEHPNIVRVYDFGMQDDQFFMVMQLVRGEDLKAVIKRDGALSPARAVEITVQLAIAVEYAHTQGLVHRDIKPENVLIDTSGAPILMDFGIAKLISNQATSEHSTIIGTPGYWAPEQAQGRTITPSTDVYALAAALYEMITGQPPFHNSSTNEAVQQVVSDAPPPPSGFNPLITPELDAIVLKGLAKSPDDRQSTAAELAHELRSALAIGSTTQVGAPPTVAAGNSLRWLLPASVGVLAMVAGLVWYIKNEPVVAPVTLEPAPTSTVVKPLTQPASTAPSQQQKMAKVATAEAEPQAELDDTEKDKTEQAQIEATLLRQEQQRLEQQRLEQQRQSERRRREVEASRPTRSFSVTGSFESAAALAPQFRIETTSNSAEQEMDLRGGDLVVRINRKPLADPEGLRQQVASRLGQSTGRGPLSDSRVFEELVIRPLDTAGGKVRLTLMRDGFRRDIYCQNFAMVVSCK